MTDNIKNKAEEAYDQGQKAVKEGLDKTKAKLQDRLDNQDVDQDLNQINKKTKDHLGKAEQGLSKGLDKIDVDKGVSDKLGYKLSKEQEEYFRIQAENIDAIQQQDTLDEPVWTTIQRDLNSIKHKIFYVLIPKNNHLDVLRLRNWDLWGPLIISIWLSFILDLSNTVTSQNPFVVVFGLMFLGSFIISINTNLLGGEVNYFQSMCVLGYCVGPFALALTINFVLGIFGLSWGPLVLILSAVAFLWSVYSSLGFMQAQVGQNKRNIAIYPIVLYFAFFFNLIAFAN